MTEGHTKDQLVDYIVFQFHNISNSILTFFLVLKMGSFQNHRINLKWSFQSWRKITMIVIFAIIGPPFSSANLCPMLVEVVENDHIV